MVKPDRWWQFFEIQKEFNCFDATSGHLPFPLMKQIADRLRESELREVIGKDEVVNVACGSGETIVTLSMAFPNVKFIPVYGIDDSTTYNEGAPLNGIVKLLTQNKNELQK